MRTTLTLDADVARLIEEEVHRLRRPFKQVVNDALRRALSPAASRAASTRYRVHPSSARLRPGLDPAHLNALTDDLDIDGATFVRRGRRVRAS
jgi:hypothetical protein